MPSSGYAIWSVVASEMPTTTKWNILGQNDASFNAGLGFADGAVIARHLSASALGAIYPIGSIYANVSNSANPATLLGFGTWTAIAGQTIAGYSSGDANFGTAGASVGAANHFHWQTVGADSGTLYIEVDGAGSGQTRVISVNRSTFSGAAQSVNSSREDGTYLASTIQPTLTVYMWQRTA
jgi:hypothetical protein